SFEKNVVNFINQKGNDSICAMYIIDLDNFKQVNDKLGHSFGDQAICDTANKLTLVFSEKDFIGRIGGDEFCVFICLKNTVKDAHSIIEQKADTMREILVEYYTDGKASVAITPSIGISIYPEQASDFKTLFKMADTALYKVKNSGKNNYLFYDKKMGFQGESVYE
ncbi:MAG: GGDEF domain-containing protein, partial [Treponema sp.]|nr:GGDEF domain-containing protein [Treponema sp.]